MTDVKMLDVGDIRGDPLSRPFWLGRGGGAQGKLSEREASELGLEKEHVEKQKLILGREQSEQKRQGYLAREKRNFMKILEIIFLQAWLTDILGFPNFWQSYLTPVHF